MKKYKSELELKRKVQKKPALVRFYSKLNSKYRVAAARSAPSNSEESYNPGVVRILVVILLLHVIGILGFCAYQSYFKKKGNSAKAMPVTQAVESPASERNSQQPENQQLAIVSAAQTQLATPSQVQPVPIRTQPVAPPATPSAPRTVRTANANEPEQVSTTRSINSEVLHSVVTGETWESISKQYGVSVEDLKAKNQGKRLFAGDLLSLPEPTKVVPEQATENQSATTGTTSTMRTNQTAGNSGNPQRIRPSKAVDSSETYAVKKGDSLWTIAKKLNVNVADLQKANKITDAKKLKIGQSLKVPQK